MHRKHFWTFFVLIPLHHCGLTLGFAQDQIDAPRMEFGDLRLRVFSKQLQPKLKEVLMKDEFVEVGRHFVRLGTADSI